MATDPVILAARLTEAETAMHRLQTGQAVRVVVDQNGERVEFTAMNTDRLRAYINELTALIANGSLTRRPVQFIF